jgi:hypothetical protein
MILTHHWILGYRIFKQSPTNSFFLSTLATWFFFWVRLFGVAQSEPRNKLGGFPELV